MGRPKKADQVRIRARLEMPAGLSAVKRKLWDREFSRFPAGFFVPSDVRTMLLYLDWVELYDNELQSLKNVHDKEAMQSLRLTGKQVMQLQRALRMMPSTRSRPEQHAALAQAPTVEPSQGDAPMAPWEQMMQDAGTLVKPKH